jgi:hypothetical protein
MLRFASTPRPNLENCIISLRCGDSPHRKAFSRQVSTQSARIEALRRLVFEVWRLGALKANLRAASKREPFQTLFPARGLKQLSRNTTCEIAVVFQTLFPARGLKQHATPCLGCDMPCPFRPSSPRSIMLNVKKNIIASGIIMFNALN